MNKGGEKPRKAKGWTKGKSREVKLTVMRKAGEKARKWHRMVSVRHMLIGALVFGLLAGLLSYSRALEEVDQVVSDMIYQAVSRKLENSPIRIIAVDKKTVKKYGEYQEWPRGLTVKLLEKLNRSSAKAPGVIGLGLNYSARKDPEGDQSLVKYCKDYKNICFSASTAVVEPAAILEQTGYYGKILLERPWMPGGQTTVIGAPFRSLQEQVTVGIINNTETSEVGMVQNAFSSVQVDGMHIDSFATAVYKMYMDYQGKEYSLPKLNKDMYFQFTISKTSQEYTVYSFCDVLDGKIAPSAFTGGIVLIGNYLDDSAFLMPGQHQTLMHEMEVQANILEAMLEQRTGQEASRRFMAMFYAFFMALFFIATSYSSVRLTCMMVVLVGTVQFSACWIVYRFGYYVNVLVPVIMAVLIAIYNLVVRYAVAIQNQYAMEDVFKKYVDESVVSELGKDGRIQAHIGVIRKDVAVLFVDIRGFTSLSEKLPPEQIVDILNSYLELVAQAVAKYRGTLDKFIGDAAMAVFNSPVDLDDYEFRAVCAALDLCSNAAALNEKCEKEHGTQVSFGIGIQCGEAVIGNIGCERRMDYTAIGDTVNTASRLEGVAVPGQILISAEMMQRLEGRIQASFAGNYTLKGKKCAVPAYTVEGIIQEPQIEAAIRS